MGTKGFCVCMFFFRLEILLLTLKCGWSTSKKHIQYFYTRTSISKGNDNYDFVKYFQRSGFLYLKCSASQCNYLSYFPQIQLSSFPPHYFRGAVVLQCVPPPPLLEDRSVCSLNWLAQIIEKSLLQK